MFITMVWFGLERRLRQCWWLNCAMLGLQYDEIQGWAVQSWHLMNENYETLRRSTSTSTTVSLGRNQLHGRVFKLERAVRSVCHDINRASVRASPLF